MSEQTIEEHQLPILDRQMVTGLMCQVLGRQEIELLKWQIQEMSDWTGAATSGVYRVSGTGRDQGQEVEWSLILKAISRTPAGKAPAGSEQEHVLYWKREALVYQSDLLDDLPGGLRGPVCYSIMEQSHAGLLLA